MNIALWEGRHCGEESCKAGFFLFNRKILWISYEIKTLREDVHSRERKMSAKADHARHAKCAQHTFLVVAKIRLCYNVQECIEPCKNTKKQTACLQANLMIRIFIGRKPVSEQRRLRASTAKKAVR